MVARERDYSGSYYPIVCKALTSGTRGAKGLGPERTSCSRYLYEFFRRLERAQTLTNVGVLTYRLEYRNYILFDLLAQRHDIMCHVFPLHRTILPKRIDPRTATFRYYPPRDRAPRIAAQSLISGETLYSNFDFGPVVKALRIRPDVYMMNGNFYPVSAAFRVAALMTRTPFVSHVIIRPSSYESRRPLRTRMMKQLMYRSSNVLLAEGRNSEDALASIYGIPSTKIYPFTLYIDRELFVNARETAIANPGLFRQKHGVHYDFVISYTGAILKLKGLRFLLKAYHTFEQRHRDLNCALLLMGGLPEDKSVDEEYTFIVQYAKENNVRNVILTGCLAHEDVAEVVAISDIFVFPSTGDTNPKSVLEAMTVGLPIILSEACGCVGTVAVHGKTAMVVKPKDDFAIFECLELLYTDKRLRDSLGSRAREVALKQTAETAAMQAAAAIEAAQRGRR